MFHFFIQVARKRERGGSGNAREKYFTAGQLQLFCSKNSCWNTLITQDHYYLPFASLAIGGKITSVFSIMYRINLESTKYSHTSHILRFSKVWAFLILSQWYHLLSIHYWLTGTHCSQVSEEGGNRNGFITGREPLILRWPHFMWDALQERHSGRMRRLGCITERLRRNTMKENVKGSSFSAHVPLGLTPGDEKQTLCGLRYPKHTRSKQSHLKVSALLAKSIH